MEFIQPAARILTTWTFVPLAIALALGLAASMRLLETKKLAKGVTVGILTAAIFVTMILLIQRDDTIESERDSKVAAQVSEKYGFELSGENLDTLDYPKEAPTSDFDVYGSFDRNSRTENGFTSIETHLVWRDGEMVLAESSNGETFTEIRKK